MFPLSTLSCLQGAGEEGGDSGFPSQCGGGSEAPVLQEGRVRVEGEEEPQPETSFAILMQVTI